MHTWKCKQEKLRQVALGQEYLLWVQVAGAKGWQPCHLHVPIVLKSGSLKLLEPYGPVQARNGIALSLLINIIYNIKHTQIQDTTCVH
jgi:hypothetical protein